MKGADYAFNPHPAPVLLVAAGIRFVGRYVSSDLANSDNGKNLGRAELEVLQAHGLAVVLYSETSGHNVLDGFAVGRSDAIYFDAYTSRLGMHGAVMYATADFDVSVQQQDAVNKYLEGAASYLGHDRTGLYGGYWPVHRAFDAGVIKYAAQACAWSAYDGNTAAPAGSEVWITGGHEYYADKRAQLRQCGQAVIGGVAVDRESSYADDFGQWPRPGRPVVVPAPARPPGADALRPAFGSLPVLGEGYDDRAHGTHWAARVQGLLIAAGIRPGKSGPYGDGVDGVYGPLTSAAVRIFQARHHLAEDGVTGPHTWACLVTGRDL